MTLIFKEKVKSFLHSTLFFPVTKQRGFDSALQSFSQKNLLVVLWESVKSAQRRPGGGVTLGLGRWQNLSRIKAGSEALENPRVQGLENFSATSPGRSLRFKSGAGWVGEGAVKEERWAAEGELGARPRRLPPGASLPSPHPCTPSTLIFVPLIGGLKQPGCRAFHRLSLEQRKPSP